VYGSLRMRQYWVTEVNASSYISCYVANVLATAEDEKRQKYMAATETCCASFSPFEVSDDGALGHEISCTILCCLAEKLSVGCYVVVLGWIRV